MDNRDEFILVLASNVAPKKYPNNSPNHFYTPLSHPLVFNADEEWKVALREITYHNTLLSVVNESIEVWRDYPAGKTNMENIDSIPLNSSAQEFGSKYLLAVKTLDELKLSFRQNILSELKNTYENIILSFDEPELDIPDMVLNEYNEDTVISVPVNKLPKNTTKVLNENNEVLPIIANKFPAHATKFLKVYGKKWSTLLHTAKPASKNYGSPESLCKEINRVLHGQSITFSIRNEGLKLFHLDTLPEYCRLVLKGGMHFIMGYKNPEFTRSEKTAEFAPDLNRGTTAIMIYCSLCEPTLVGDNFVPLLRIAHLTPTSEHGAVVNQQFNLPIHIPISHAGIVNCIEIALHTDSGEEFPLSGDGKVLLTLQFRKSRNMIHD
jgi:hypothetical protein